jgi:hypothetical protein
MTTTDTTDTTDTTTALVDAYFDLWNETDPAARAERTAQVWTEDGRHVDPLADVAGHDGLAAMMAGVHDRFPGHTFVRTSAVDEHHGCLRYGWQLVQPDGGIVVAATDIAELDGDGRVRSVIAFFGDLPAA